MPTTLPQSYKVRSGETLSGIASKYGMTWQQLQTANPSITNPNLIYPDQVLNIPTGPAPVEQIRTPEPVVPIQVLPPKQDEIAKLKAQIEQVTSQIAEKQALVTKAQAAGIKPEQEIPEWVSQAETPQAATQTSQIKGLEATAFGQPTQNYDVLKKQKYEEAGLGDIKTKIDDLDKQILDTKNKLYGEEAEIMENPWLSNASRVGRVRTLYDMANKQIGNLLDERKILADQYTAGISDIEKSIGVQFGLEEQQRELAQKQLQYLAPSEQKTQIVSVGGRQLLIDTATGQTIQDLGEVTAKEPTKPQVQEVQGGLYDITNKKWLVAPKEVTTKFTSDDIGSYIQKRKEAGEGWATIEAELRAMGVPTYTGSPADKLLNRMFGGGGGGGETSGSTQSKLEQLELRI